MALFFDGEWFDAKLAAAHLSRADVARALGVSEPALAEIWKDQRELSTKDVSILAALLAVTPRDIAEHAGIATPVPGAEPEDASAIGARLSRLESDVAAIKAHLFGSKA